MLGCPSLPCPVCIVGGSVSPLLWAWSQLFLSSPLSDNHCAESLIKARHPRMILTFNLAQSRPRPPGLRGVGELSNSSQLASPLREVGRPAGGARSPGLAPPGRRRPVLVGPPCLPLSPLPPLGLVPVKLWSITRSLSRLPHISAPSLPPPPAPAS